MNPDTPKFAQKPPCARVSFQPHSHSSGSWPRPPQLLSESLLLPAYQQPPPMFGPRGATVPPRYCNRYQPPRRMQRFYHQGNDARGNDEEHWCETCDRGFKTLDLLKSHILQHQKCNIDGCQFVAHPKVITKHIQMQHSSGLYSKISKLTDPEEIKKWREERRKKFPTKANIDKKNAEIKEKVERGEKMGLHKKTFPDNSKHHRKHNFEPRKKFNAPRRPKLRKNYSACPESKPKHKLPAFTGINQLVESDSEEDISLNNSNFCIDDEIDLPVPFSDSKNKGAKKDIVCGAITHLIANYGTSDEDDETNINFDNKDNSKYNLKTNTSIGADLLDKHMESNVSIAIKNNTSEAEDDGGPEEIKIVKTTENTTEEIPVISTIAPEKHAGTKSTRNLKSAKEAGKITKRNTTRKLPSTLLEKLLSNEIQRERNVMLQCIRYVVNQNFFEK